MLFSKVIKLPFSNPVWVSSLRSMLFSKVIKHLGLFLTEVISLRSILFSKVIKLHLKSQNL